MIFYGGLLINKKIDSTQTVTKTNLAFMLTTNYFETLAFDWIYKKVDIASMKPILY